MKIILSILAIVLLCSIVSAESNQTTSQWVDSQLSSLDYSNPISMFMKMSNIIYQLVYEVNYWHNVADIRSTWHPYCSSGSGVITEIVEVPTYEPTHDSISDNWERTDCSEDNYWCKGADINKDGQVDVGDLGICAVTPSCAD